MTDYPFPNLYSFATKELSQDATLAYILAWADPKYGNASAAHSGMHALGRALLGALVTSHPDRKDWAPEKVTSVEVGTQEKRVDVRADITTEDGKVFLIVEDKVHSGEHGDQIRRYVEKAQSRYGESEIVPVYLKTGNESPNRNISIRCGRFFRSDLLTVLNDHRETGNQIVDDFRDYWQAFDNQTEKWRDRKVAAWGWRQVEGCYLELERHEPKWHWGVDTRGFQQVLNFWADSLMMNIETIPEIQLRVEIENARTNVDLGASTMEPTSVSHDIGVSEDGACLEKGPFCRNGPYASQSAHQGRFQVSAACKGDHPEKREYLAL